MFRIFRFQLAWAYGKSLVPEVPTSLLDALLRDLGTQGFYWTRTGIEDVRIGGSRLGLGCGARVKRLTVYGVGGCRLQGVYGMLGSHLPPTSTEING